LNVEIEHKRSIFGDIAGREKGKADPLTKGGE
jgi:hypothetical protein